jgi:hypothetical protein
VDRQQIAGVMTAAGRVRILDEDGSERYLHLARATDPLRRPVPMMWGLEDLWFGVALVISRARRAITRNRDWRVEITPSLRERPTCVVVGRDRAHAAELAASFILDSGAHLDRNPW